MAIQSITPFLWFDTNAEEAANFYVSVFDNARITHVSRHGGSVMVVGFELEGQRLLAINGGPAHTLSEAFSLLVNCTHQADIDRLWARLGEGGSYNVCGWLKDRFGLSWQINYAGLPELMGADPAKADRVMRAMMAMSKIDVQALKHASEALS